MAGVTVSVFLGLSLAGSWFYPTGSQDSEREDELVPGVDYEILPPEVMAEIIIEVCRERVLKGEKPCHWNDEIGGNDGRRR